LILNDRDQSLAQEFLSKENGIQLVFLNKSLFDKKTAELHFRHGLVHVAGYFQFGRF